MKKIIMMIALMSLILMGGCYNNIRCSCNQECEIDMYYNKYEQQYMIMTRCCIGTEIISEGGSSWCRENYAESIVVGERTSQITTI